MDETTPRPLPPQILGAYRDPTALRSLLVAQNFWRFGMGRQEDAYSSEDCIAVREEFIRLLEARHGVAWVSVGRGERTAAAKARSFRSDAVKGIDYLIDVPEYADKRDWHRLLSMAMEPRWQVWWGTFRDARSVGLVARYVLTDRQMRWLTAQYARTVLDGIAPDARDLLLRAIAVAESYALGTLDVGRRRATMTPEEIALAQDEVLERFREEALLAMGDRALLVPYRIAISVTQGLARIAVVSTISGVVSLLSDRRYLGTMYYDGYEGDLARLADLTRELFRASPPSLV